MRRGIVVLLGTISTYFGFLICSSSFSANASELKSKVIQTQFVGTERSPAVVKLLPNEKSKEDLDQEAYERGEKREIDRTSATSNTLTAIATAFAVLVAIVQAAMFFYQLKLMRKTLEDSKRSVDAAVLSAEASRDGAEISKRSMIASARPYVHFAGMSWRSHQYVDTNKIFWRLRSRWVNSGTTPTRGLRGNVSFILTEHPLPENHQFAYAIDASRPTVGIAPGGELTFSLYDIWGEDLLAVKNGRKFLYAYGIVRYRSIFEEAGEHVTKFCVAGVNVTGDPLKKWNDAEPLGIDFMSFGVMNCADEDCPG